MVADEFRLQETPHAFYRWNTRGESPVVKIKNSSESKSFYGALSKNNHKVLTHVCDKQNSDETIKFLEHIKQFYQDKGEVLVIWDNASWHKSNKVKEWLVKNPNIIKLANFPPYSPQLNPQEHVWKEVRRELSEIIHDYTFRQVVDRACRVLLNTKFKYSIF